MTVKIPSTTKRLHSTARKPATAPAPEVLRQLPAKSLDKAGKAFEKFSLSRFTQNSRPATYVPRLKENDPQAVQDLQRELIRQRIKALPNADALNPGMSLALTPAEMEKSPSKLRSGLRHNRSERSAGASAAEYERDGILCERKSGAEPVGRPVEVSRAGASHHRRNKAGSKSSKKKQRVSQ